MEIDPELDRLYVRTVRCPYCKARIRKYTTTCARCGVHKMQVLDASNKRAKEIIKGKTGEKVLKTKNKPHDITFTRMALLLIFGLLGTHNFYVGRRWRGMIMLSFVLITILFLFIFPMGPMSDGLEGMHHVRKMFVDRGLLFPADFLFVIAFFMWGYDTLAIIFGFYKYPVRLGEETTRPAKPQSITLGEKQDAKDANKE